MLFQNKYQKVTELLHASTGLRLLAKNATSHEQKFKLEHRAEAVDKMASDLAAKVGKQDGRNNDFVSDLLNREKRNANDFYQDVKQEDLPTLVQHYMGEVKSMEGEAKRSNEIMNNILK